MGQSGKQSRYGSQFVGQSVLTSNSFPGLITRRLIYYSRYHQSAFILRNIYLSFFRCLHHCQVCTYSQHIYSYKQYKHNIVTYRPIARQRLAKHILAGVNARNNRTSIARQRIIKQAFSTKKRLCFMRGPGQGIMKRQRRSSDLVVRS
jgi:hypothetical protein